MERNFFSLWWSEFLESSRKTVTKIEPRKFTEELDSKYSWEHNVCRFHVFQILKHSSFTSLLQMPAVAWLLIWIFFNNIFVKKNGELICENSVILEISFKKSKSSFFNYSFNFIIIGNLDPENEIYKPFESSSKSPINGSIQTLVGPRNSEK